MSTFSELLTEYMTRTGISDSELARHLGISRQTIFRWKEGLTARPRVREDVLKCAERLRLTSAERDALLLAAGFAPEQISPPSESPHAMVDASALVSVEPPIIHIPSDLPTPKRARRWLALLVAALLVAVLAGLLFALPSTAQNLIALVFPPTPTRVPSPTPTPLPPELVVAVARLNSRGGQPPAYDVTARLRQTLEREIESENLFGVRLADVGDSIRDAQAAERVRVRAGAEAILWGNFSGDDARVEITSAARVPLTGTLLSAFPLAPRDQSVTLNMSAPTQVRALALTTLLPMHLARGNADRARNAYETARGLTPYSREMRAALDFYRGYLAQTTAPRDLDTAVEAYNRALDVTSVYEAYLNRGLALLAQNEDAGATSDFANAQALDPARPEAFRATCWVYALEQQPQTALPYCDAATARDETAWSLDARGVVYAELGRYAEAANEFANFLHWLDTQPLPARERYAATRQAWIETLRAGKNPFDAATLNQLRGIAVVP
ncbi:MAG: hypothetical protein HY741_10460 [Chloroflexi bacterium]|nr:hypothetical protein [Chloroflexota bacterium]